MTVTLSEPAVAKPAANERLEYLRNKKIVVVDDAFDAPTGEQLDEEDVLRLLEDCAESQELKATIEGIAKLPVAEIKELSDEQISTLWSMKDEQSAFGEVLRTTIFADAVDKLSNVQPFCKHLRDLKFEVVEVGQAGDIPKENVALVLVDYVLGPEGKESDEGKGVNLFAQAVSTSEEVVKRFYQSFPEDADKPFIVLMSSLARVDVLVDAFQKNTELLRGMFDFVTKTELCTPPNLEFKLRTWNYSLPSRHDIQHFVEALSGSMDKVTERFRDALKQLSFQDYTYIQSLALQDDGHPLGDYMLWLYSSFLGDLLLAEPKVIKQRKKLDSMEFPAVLPTEEPPSTQLADLYQTAVGSASGPLGGHPRQTGAATETSAPAYAELGDVFVKNASHDVYMVLNAACDLAFAPHSPRACDPEQAILLIPGRLTPLYELPPDMKLPRTELFAYDKKLYRIVWRDDRVFSIPHRDLFAKMRETGHERRYRLRLPYALLIQQAFASKLTRVGLPVAPPICVTVDVELHCVGDDGNGKLLGAPVKGGAFIIHRKHKNEFIQEFVLTGKCVHAIIELLDEAANQQLRVPLSPVPVIPGKDGKPDEGKQRDAEEKQKIRLQKKFDAIQSYKEKHDFWFSLVTTPRVLPEPGNLVQLEQNFLALYRDGLFTDAWAQRPFICLNVKYGARQSTAPAEADGLQEAELDTLHVETAPESAASTEPKAEQNDTTPPSTTGGNT